MLWGSNKDKEEQKPKVQAPTVYDDAMEMLIGSVVIYIFAELRGMVREGEVADLKLEDVSPPLTAAKVLEIIQSHKEILRERALDQEYLESRLKTLQQVHDMQQSQQQSNSDLFKFIFSLGKEEKDAQAEEKAVLKRFEDHNSTEELVHAIVVNPQKKRISVVFRGSVTPKDFLQDAKCAQLSIENPVLSLLDGDANVSEAEMPKNIRLHTGFHEYLFHQRDGVTRLDSILTDIKKLLREYPGYALYMTGHSLGGALCTLCGFFGACDDELLQLAANGKIVVYSVASPYCGNWKFRHAFQELERRRRLQHLRIANLEDMVTNLPFAVPKATFLSPVLSMAQGAGNLYKHVGIRLQIRKDDNGVVSHSISYPKEQHCENDQEYAKELQNAMDQGKSLVKAFYFLCTRDFETVEKYHSCEEYEQRFESCRQAFREKTLEDLYKDSTIVGRLFDQDFKPSPQSANGLARVVRAWSILNRSSKEGEVDKEDEEEMTLSEAALAK